MSLVRNSAQYLTKSVHKLHQIQRLVHASALNNEKFRKCEEIQIPVPWGYIAGQWWGPQDKRPFVCLHGWQESCASFVPLIQQFPEDVSFLAIDFPGHGHSSWYPPGIYYHALDNPITIRRIHKYFNWPKISLIGHSMGAVASFMYTSLYPDDVDVTITLDALKPFRVDPQLDVKTVAKRTDKFLQCDALNMKAKSRPSYTYKELVDKFYNGAEKSISYENCKYMISRIIEPSQEDPEKFHFLIDSRVKIGPLLAVPHEHIREHTKQIKCPVLFLKANQAPDFEEKKYLLDVIELLTHTNKNFELVRLDGTHHVHINEPKKVADIIKKFLKKYDIDHRSNECLQLRNEN